VTGVEVILRCENLRRDAALLLASSILDSLEPPFSGGDELLYSLGQASSETVISTDLPHVQKMAHSCSN
jgi:hypothetical protein